jgi:hypothetical protein
MVKLGPCLRWTTWPTACTLAVAFSLITALPEQCVPHGAYHKGGSYGPDVNLPIPIEEQNNPNR